MKGMLASLGMFGVIMAGVVLGLELASWLFLSQVQIPTSLDGVTSITSIGFAVWYGWYITTRAIPRIADKADERADAQSKRYDQQLATVATKHESQIARMEDAHTKQLESMAAAFRDSLKETRDHCYALQVPGGPKNCGDGR